MWLNRLMLLFPAWALFFGGLAFTFPAPWQAAKPAIVPLLGVVMFGMGMTLTPANFVEVLRRPRQVGTGILLQYGVMPLTAWIIGRALGLPPELLAGLILVGASPGGTASNVVCYLARGDVALSITLTTVSTLLAIVLTPVLTLAYAGHSVPVPALPMLWSVFKIVLLPVAAGVLVNRLAHDRVHRLKHLFPLISVASIVIIIAVIVALNRDNIAALGVTVIAAVVLHNATGLASGYAVARLFGYERRIARTLAIEVGMQNSGLAVALAVKYFSAVAALPGAIFSIWHNLSGSVLAAWWSRREGTRQGIRMHR